MNPPVGNADGGAQILVVEIDPAEVASGTTKTVSVTPGAPGIAVPIPAGVSDNAMFRLPGAGAPAYPGGPATDVVIQVRIRQSAPPAPPAPPFGAPSSGAPVPPFGAPSSGAPVPPAGAPAGFGAAPFGPPSPLAAPAKPGTPWARIVLPLLLTLGVGAFAVSGGFKALISSIGGPSDDAPSPVSTEVYQQALSDADKKLAAGFTSLAEADTPTAIHDTAADFSVEVHAMASDFKALTPPAEIASTHSLLTNALESLGVELTDTAAAGEASEVCRGSAASTAVSSAGALDSLRSVAQELATVDPGHAYTFGASLPKKTKPLSRSLANGAFVKKSSKKGQGELKITNSDTDVVISLVPVGKKTTLLSVYVRAHQSRTVTGVPDGVYNIYWTGGKDWDKSAKAFTQNCSFAKFDDTLEFTTSGTTYTIWEIGLQKSVGGNAPSSGVDPGAFPQG